MNFPLRVHNQPGPDSSLRAFVEEKAVCHTLHDLCRDLRFVCLAMKTYNETVRFTREDFDELNSMVDAFINMVIIQEQILSVLRDAFDKHASFISPEEIAEILRDRSDRQSPQAAPKTRDRRHA